jgi:hypothetical protein
MDWIQAIAVMATVIATGYYIHREIQMDMRAAGARTDRVDEMFCDLQKQMKDEMITIKQEQYDFMKENRK